MPQLRLLVAALIALPSSLLTQVPQARVRWERLCQIRKDKFRYILPEAMRENGIDMWIVAMKEGHYDPFWELLGRGYVGGIGFYIFTDRGDRIERAALGIDDHNRDACGAYDVPDAEPDLLKFVTARNPKKIALNMSEAMGFADGLTYSLYNHITKTLGSALSARIVSAEKLASDFSSRRVASEIVAFGEAGEMGRQIAERALSNEVITPGVTTLRDVSWWILQQELERGLGTSFDVPSVYITGPDGIEATSTDRIIQRGDLVMLDFGVGYLTMYTDQKRIAYVLKAGETAPPVWLTNAFDQARKVRDVIQQTIKPGKTAGEMIGIVEGEIAKAGFRKAAGFNMIAADGVTEFFIGCHSVGDWGHGIGPSVAFFNPDRQKFELRPGNLLSIELFAWTPSVAWGGKKVRIPLEDDAVVTARGVEWVYPANPRLLVVR